MREKIWRTPIAKCHTCCLLTCCINFENFACFPKKSKVFTFKKSQEPYSEYIFFSFQIPSCYFKNNRLKGKVEIEFFSAQFFSSKITTLYYSTQEGGGLNGGLIFEKASFYIQYYDWGLEQKLFL